MGFFDAFRRQKERRKHLRHRVVSTAWLRLDNARLPVVSVLWDLSEGGARLAVAAPTDLPDEFTLLLSRDSQEGIRCRVAWRSREQVGVQFSENPEAVMRLIDRMVVPVA